MLMFCTRTHTPEQTTQIGCSLETALQQLHDLILKHYRNSLIGYSKTSIICQKKFLI